MSRPKKPTEDRLVEWFSDQQPETRFGVLRDLNLLDKILLRLEQKEAEGTTPTVSPPNGEVPRQTEAE